MKILVTGEKGKIGQGFCSYVKGTKAIIPDCITLRDDKWKDVDFKKYDSIYYCVGIVDENSDQMENINVNLAEEVAQKAKTDGVKTFIYLSSMAVYGFDLIPLDAEITLDTIATPTSRYGKSKLAGEEVVARLADNNFHVHIVRAPSIYGRTTEAYLEMYERMAKKGKFFDAFHEQKRSAIYIDNLSELIYRICSLDTFQKVCYYYPQNRERYSVSEFVHEIAERKGIKCKFHKLPNFMQKGILKNMRFVRKLKIRCRSIAYSEEISKSFNNEYCVIDTKTSIYKTLINQ